MMHAGNDTTEESNWAIRRTKKVHGMIKYTEKQFQKHFFHFMPLLHQLFEQIVCLVALRGFKIPSPPGCGNFFKYDDRKVLITNR
jgi:hypothetical protein